MNKWLGTGNLTKDVELRYNGEQAIAKFTLASNDLKKANFIPVTVFGRNAEACNMYLKKGSKAGVIGHIDTGSYEKDGRTIYTWEVIADAPVEFLDRKEKEEKLDIPF